MKNNGIRALANAIRRGGKGRRKAISTLYDEFNHGAVCALGAAYVDSFGLDKLKLNPDSTYRYTELRKRFPILKKSLSLNKLPEYVKLYAPWGNSTTIEQLIVNLNDYTSKSRAWIADYLEKIASKVK